MATPIFAAAHFQDEAAAFAYVEARVWPGGVICPRCGVVGQAKRLQGKTTRPGLWKCYACMQPFTVKVGTVMESSHIPVHIWLQAMHLLCSSKKESAVTSFTGLWASLSSPLGSFRIVSARL